jgi:hypothetical protein
MRAKLLIVILIVPIVAALILLPRFRVSPGNGKVSRQSMSSTNVVVAVSIVTNPEIERLRDVVNDYHSTNHHTSFASVITHELIAEQLKTNAAFLEWATNVAATTIADFVKNGGVPIYGITNFSADALQFDKVTVDSWNGLFARAIYDPTPTLEGPLEFNVEGGIHPLITRIQNGYRMEKYQLDPSLWTRAPRNLGRMDWSGATAPLNKSIVKMMVEQAFHELTGMNLDTLHIGLEISTPEILNTDASHPTETVAGENAHAKLYSSKDYLYPFATFSINYTNVVLFEGEIVQTSAERGEFVSITTLERNTQALFDFGEKFLGNGTWERDMLDQVNSMNKEQQREVYQRIFRH